MKTRRINSPAAATGPIQEFPLLDRRSTGARQHHRFLLQVSRQSGVGQPDACEGIMALLAASRSVNYVLKGLMGTAELSDGSLAALVVLYAHEPLPESAADLAYHAEVSQASMARILYSLARRGWVVRNSRGAAGRGRPIQLTAQGQQAAGLIAHRFLIAADRIGTGLSPRQRRTLMAACERLRNHAQSLGDLGGDL